MRLCNNQTVIEYLQVEMNVVEEADRGSSTAGCEKKKQRDERLSSTPAVGMRHIQILDCSLLLLPREGRTLRGKGDSCSKATGKVQSHTNTRTFLSCFNPCSTCSVPRLDAPDNVLRQQTLQHRQLSVYGRFLSCPCFLLPGMPRKITVDSLRGLLHADRKVKVAGIDVDGVLRGKLISTKKFLSIAQDGFGFCSVIFGWDMHDMTYFRELKISNKENGYHDIVAFSELGGARNW